MPQWTVLFISWHTVHSGMSRGERNGRPQPHRGFAARFPARRGSQRVRAGAHRRAAHRRLLDPHPEPGLPRARGPRRRGLVEAGPAGPRSRQPYRLTDEGRAAFAAWLAEPPGSEQIRYPLLLTIAFGSALDRDRLTEFIDGHRADHEKRLADYRERVAAGAPDRFTEATLAFGIRYEEAVLAWMDELPAILDGR